MIREVRGDILLSKARALAHGVSPNDDFAHGLAIRERWPALYKDFRHHCRQTYPQSGSLLATGVGGLHWEAVRPLVERHLGDLSIPVYVYTTYEAGRAAEES